MQIKENLNFICALASPFASMRCRQK